LALGLLELVGLPTLVLLPPTEDNPEVEQLEEPLALASAVALETPKAAVAVQALKLLKHLNGLTLAVSVVKALAHQSAELSVCMVEVAVALLLDQGRLLPPV
jgi:hypothetical protein